MIPAYYHAPTTDEGSNAMRGADEQSGSMFSYVSLEERVPKDHPLRAIRRITDRALEQLCGHDPRAGRAVELAYFGGMSQDEIATVLGVPAETVDRDLRFARAWLNRTLAG